MRGMNVIHQPIAWSDLLQNPDYHTARFVAEGRNDFIPVYLGDGEINPYACMLMSLGAFRTFSDDADPRLLEFWMRYHAEPSSFPDLAHSASGSVISKELAEVILTRRKELSARKVCYAYIYTSGRGYQGIIAIFLADADMSFLTQHSLNMLILAPQGDDWYRRVMGADIRSSEVKGRYGEVPALC